MDDDLDRELADLAAQQGTKPSRESMREVKREAKARERARRQQQKAADTYWAEQTGRSSTGRSGRGAVAVLAVLALVLGGAAAWWFLLRPPETAPQPETAAAPRARVSTPPADDDGTAPVDGTAPDPFSGTPAKGWKVGAAGIVIPKQKVAGLYSRVQVDEALATTKRYLVAAMLERPVLFQAALEPVLSTLDPRFDAQARESIAEGDYSWVGVANRLHPGDWVLVSRAIRVNGSMSAGAGKDRELVVRFSYVTALWVRPAAGGEPRTLLVRRSGALGFPQASGDSAGPPWPRQGSAFTNASVCGYRWPYEQFLAAWPQEPKGKPTGSTTGTEAFDFADPDAPDPEGCFRDVSGF